MFKYVTKSRIPVLAAATLFGCLSAGAARADIITALRGYNTQPNNGVVSVPAASVVREGSSSAVYVVERGRARRRTVVLGAQGADRDEVRSGVVEGERVVVRDADKLHDGQAVR